MAGLFDASRMYEALAEMGLLPQHSTDISRGTYDASANRMTGTRKSTQAHEMTHAVQWNLLMNSAKRIQDKKAEGSKVSQQEQQFLDALQKVYGLSFANTFAQLGKAEKNIENAERVREAQLKSLYKSRGNKNYDAYRTGRTELEAFGVGDMSSMDVPLDVPPHLNPTMAQEFDILFSMYSSLPKDVKTGFAETRKKELEEMKQKGYRDERLDVLQFEDLTSDPFKRTIK
jgi:hypothetical protein